MTKQIQLFMTARDEEMFSELLLDALPNLAFVDGNRWKSREPPLAHSIARCQAPWVFLWDPSIVEVLPTYARPDGEYEGPATGVVVEYTRSRQLGNLLLSGRIAQNAGGKDSEQTARLKAFARTVWKCMQRIAVHRIVAVEPSSGQIVNDLVREYLAGTDAISWCGTKDNFFRDRSVKVFFKPKSRP